MGRGDVSFILDSYEIIERGVENMKIENIEQKTAKNGKPYFMLTIDGKNFTWFNDISSFSIGDNVICEFEKKGEYTNLIKLEKVTTENKGQLQIPPKVEHHTIVMEHKVKPHSFEFGKPNDRHKIYYDTIEELKEHIAALKNAGFAEEIGVEVSVQNGN